MLAIDKTPYMVDFKIPYVNVNAIDQPKVLESIKGPFIVDATHDPHSIAEVQKNIELMGHTDVIYLTSNFNDKDLPNTIFFPYFFFRCNLKYKFKPTVGKRSYQYSCLNRNPRSHRLYTIYKILNSSINANCMLSSHGLVCPYSQEFKIIDKHFLDLPVVVREYLKTINLNISAYAGDSGNNFDEPGNPGDHDWTHPAFSDTYLNIVTESSAMVSFVTEKTFKPLAAGQLFLLVSGPGTVDALRYLGFDTYDSILNNHSYDLETNYQTRINQLIDLLESIKNIEELYFSNLITIQQNQEYALSNDFIEKCLKPLRELDILA